MTRLQYDILLVILKSQLDIENSALERLKVMQERYNTIGVSDWISVTNARMNEIKRQIEVMESSIKKETILPQMNSDGTLG